jgi:hypothetical protein
VKDTQAFVAMLLLVGFCSSSISMSMLILSID